MAAVLAYVAAGMVGLWGVSHAIPTMNVVAGFGEISTDNRRVLVQEWLAEAVAMWAFAALVIVVTATGVGLSVTDWVYRAIAGALLLLAVLTAFTGARTPVIWFKICPGLLTSSAVLLLVASFT
ncbi:hypothetical protein HFP15_29130 [Amycolatopsis sp. K13G38]|uniref:DUF1304 domain-containing protein n=1 Tax=Amycolatopsis acididurans TaxID=2724524 RepID=A0ABX1JB70_9PSEU|nr:hypothetical protein [Amycolatopsis acididurans]NKQ56939.1 hypothetical protein [Amycolatopsis acididurans]